MRYGQPADISTFIRDVAEDDPDDPRPAATREHDVFISHASKDKQGVVSDLVGALQNEGVNVWYDEFELKPGDSLRRKIDEGLTRSRFGLVVVSRNFFEEAWTNQELDGIVALEVAGRQRIIPVWHQVTKDDVLDYSPTLADRVALNTTTHSVAEIAEMIAQVVHPPQDGGSHEITTV